VLPEILHPVDMAIAIGVLASGVIYGLVVAAFFIQSLLAACRT
jgi:hypothetical protein